MCAIPRYSLASGILGVFTQPRAAANPGSESGSGLQSAPLVLAIADRLTARPALVAALLYAALALLLVSPALWPGRTLSSSDAIWNSVPWAGLHSAINGVGSNTQLGGILG